MSKTIEHCVQAGTEWMDSKKRIWVVHEVLPFGRCRVRTQDRSRVGEMHTKAVRNAVTDQLARAITMAEGTARTGPETCHSSAEALEGNRDVFEAMFGKQITDAAFDHVLEKLFESTC